MSPTNWWKTLAASAVLLSSLGHSMGNVLGQSNPMQIRTRLSGEVDSLLGIKLNAPLQITNDCADARSEEECIRSADDYGYGYKQTLLDHCPDLGVGSTWVTVGTLDSKVENVTIDAHTQFYDDLRRIAIAKFGPPDEKKSDPQYGETLVWHSIGVTVELDEINEARSPITLDEPAEKSRLSMVSVPLDAILGARVKAEESKSANKAASKL
ncbi:hypothetical protein M3I54_41905 [Paraburkholderia sp. CNPSo 3274]|uniref:hypothetical protein n=1 Tax=Paraburkholderia sp. CNPSo 3274 TaxID=2940932 RepID=UPI0020B8235D|nr:hypothetical protein [Paraburkholderia sp. CNPSo 3274]MCP3713340.1 hypothetical protein [Paraburkholderia sp. CNPSo 3274]